MSLSFDYCEESSIHGSVAAATTDCDKHHPGFDNPAVEAMHSKDKKLGEIVFTIYLWPCVCLFFFEKSKI